MGTARSVLFTVLSVILTAAGCAGIASDIIITSDRIYSPESSMLLTLSTAFLIFIYSLLNIIGGISGAKNYNRRTNSAVMIRLPEIAIALCVVSIITAFLNGIILWHLILLCITGILIPVVFIYSAVKKSYV